MGRGLLAIAALPGHGRVRPPPMAAKKRKLRKVRERAPAGAASTPSRPPRSKRPPRDEQVIAILSRKRSLYSTHRLVEAIRQRGHRPAVLDTLRCNLILSATGPR